MKSCFIHTAMRVKKYGAVQTVDVRSVNERTKEVTDFLLLFKSADDVIFIGAEHLHPLTKAEAKNCAKDAIAIGMGKHQIDARSTLSELESSRKRQASRARQFSEAITGWSNELMALSDAVKCGLDSPTLRSRLNTMALNMERLKPKK